MQQHHYRLDELEDDTTRRFQFSAQPGNEQPSANSSPGGGCDRPSGQSTGATSQVMLTAHRTAGRLDCLTSSVVHILLPEELAVESREVLRGPPSKQICLALNSSSATSASAWSSRACFLP